MWVLITCNRLIFPHPDHWGQKSSACRCRCWGCRKARNGFEDYIVQTLCLFVRVVCVSFCFSQGQVNSTRFHFSGETFYIGCLPYFILKIFQMIQQGHHLPVPPWYCSVWRLGGDLQGFLLVSENWWKLLELGWIEPTYFRRILHDITWICMKM